VLNKWVIDKSPAQSMFLLIRIVLEIEKDTLSWTFTPLPHVVIMNDRSHKSAGQSMFLGL
jgi:hypothetical protein